MNLLCCQNGNKYHKLYSDDGEGLINIKGDTLIPPNYYAIKKIVKSTKNEKQYYLTNKFCGKDYNIINVENKRMFEKDQKVIIQASEGYFIVTDYNLKSQLVDLDGNKIDKIEKWMIEPIIASEYRFDETSYYKIGKNGENSFHQGLMSDNYDFIFPLDAHKINVHETSITVRNNSGDGGKLYDTDINEIWSDEKAISDYAFQNTFVFSNQTNYTGGILSFEGDTLFSSELMRFSKIDIKYDIIKYSTHFTHKCGAINTKGKVIIPINDSYIYWKEKEEGNYHLEYIDSTTEKKVNYNPATKSFYTSESI